MITNQVRGIILKSNGETCYVPFEATFEWDPEDPLAVEIVIEDGNVWTIGRELLQRGATSLASVGDGDVRIKKEGPVSSRLLVCFRSPEGHADVGFNQPHVVRFLKRTEAVCLVGEEDIDAQLDEALEDILSS